jgi:mannose-6-phosphate isomerase
VKAGVTKEMFRTALAKGDVEPLLLAIPVRAGDCHYLLSGTLHALGAGSMVVEVQTPSDTTFRVFDWNRLGPGGKPRQLHVEEAMACIDFGGQEAGKSETNRADELVNCEHFSLRRMQLGQNEQREIAGGEPVVWVALEGQGVIQCEGHGPTAFVRGDTLLLPAGMKQGRVKSVAACAWLEARLPGKVAGAA